MVKIDLIRIKKLRYLGTYLLREGSDGGDLPEDNILDKTVSMYIDCELAPTTHFIIDDGSCKMYMRHSGVSGAFSNWERFTEIK